MSGPRLPALGVSCCLVGVLLVARAGAGPGEPAETRRVAQQSGPVPILAFHHVPSRRHFARQMSALARAGFRGVTLDDVWRSWRYGAALPRSPVVITLDDGYADQYRNAAPVLRRLRWPASLALVSAWLDHPGFLTTRQAAALTARGWEAAAHSVSHPDLTRVRPARLLREIAGSRETLESALRVPVRFFSYPYGRSNRHVRAAVADAGFVGATTIRRGAARSRGDRFALPRIMIGAAMSPERLVRRVRAAVRSSTVARAAGEPRCFGAAARDPRRPCSNPDLRLSVLPTPAVARLGRNAPCALVEKVGQVGVCAFGAPADRAVRTIGLLGDSHAGHWRAALALAAEERGWHGVSLTQTGCPLSRATKILREPLFDECRRWNVDVVRWLAGHPEVSTIVVSQIVSRTGVVPERGRSKFATAVGGYVEAWRSLPSSVQRVIVIRDNPKARGVLPCVERAIAARRPAGSVCAIPRREALERDPAMVAAARVRGSRVATVDLSRFFCGRARCFPVIGGALVYKDNHHLTQVYSRTLAPYLGRRIDAVRAP